MVAEAETVAATGAVTQALAAVPVDQGAPAEPVVKAAESSDRGLHSVPSAEPGGAKCAKRSPRSHFSP
jgi:hypothetical protein